MKKKAKKSAKKPAAKKKVAVKPITRKPRQPDLPGMEGRGIRELEDKANELDDAQTQKKEYSSLCTLRNDELVSLMKKHGKTEYHHKTVHIVLPDQKQKAKVTIGEIIDNDPRDIENESPGDPEPHDDEFAEEHEDE